MPGDHLSVNGFCPLYLTALERMPLTRRHAWTSCATDWIDRAEASSCMPAQRPRRLFGMEPDAAPAQPHAALPRLTPCAAALRACPYSPFLLAVALAHSLTATLVFCLTTAPFCAVIVVGMISGAGRRFFLERSTWRSLPCERIVTSGTV